MKQTGFTILELLLAVAIVAILAAVALPAFNYAIENNRMKSTANAVTGALNLARAEAAQRGTIVSVSSISGGGDWSTGYRVWWDADGSGGFTAGDEIRVFEAVGGGLSLTGSANNIDFNASGFAENPAITIDLCSTEASVTGRSLNVALSGRVNITADTAGTICP